MLIGPQNSPSDAALIERWRALNARIGAAANACGRSEQQVTLLAVSKGHDAGRVRLLARAGQEHFGENYLQEALPKLDALADLELSWHFIGRLQANKTRAVAERFAWVHTLDRLRTAERLSAQRPHYAPPLNVCLQVNIAGDSRKAGATPEAAAALAVELAALPRLRLRGLMCMLPEHAAAEAARAHYLALGALRDALNGRGLALDTLSMGMSSDFELAIGCGATLIRVGTALFGARPAA